MSSARLRIPSNRTTPAFTMKSITILIFLFACSVSLAETEDSSDFIFDDKNLQEIVTEEKVHKYTSSHENSHPKTVPLVDLLNQADGNDDLIADDSYFSQINRQLRRLKRSWWDDVFGEPSTTQPTATESLAISLNTAEMKTTADKTKRSPDDPEMETDSKEDPEDDESTEIDGDTNSTNAIPSYSGDSSSPIPVPSNDGAVRRAHFRIMIVLAVPYTIELSDHNSILFNDYADNIHTAMYDIFKAPSFIKPRLAAFINSALPIHSKAIIDLELEGTESSTQIESKIATHLATYRSLGSIPASSEMLMVKDIEGSLVVPCDITQIPCLETNVCYSITKRCDGKFECPDSSDEADCPASDQSETPTEANHGSTCRGDSTYVCRDNGSGKSITICMEHKCDGRLHCPLGDDEWDCTISCSETEFVCDGKCLPNEKSCDGIRDCINGSDEEDCPPPKASCKPFEEFSCAASGVCIPSYLRCDNISNCNDRSDEENCTKNGECLSNQIKCYDGTCINGPFRCDGKPDCSTGEDELGCPNIEYPSTPRPTSRPPPDVKPVCRPGQFRCANGDCVNNAFRCDGVIHCSDYSDEEFCSSTPKPCDGFLCRSGLCVDRSRVCDGRGDCPDFSDEDSCEKVCRNDEFNCGDGRCIKMSFKCDGRVDCDNGRDETGCPAPPTSCTADQFQCNDGTCIPFSGQCDGRTECPDSSDESLCPPSGPPAFSSPCQQNQFDCGDNRCIPLDLKCDGLADCQNGRDEIGCPPRIVCNQTEFDCGDNLCIPYQLKCDGRPDCPNGKDETGCPDRPVICNSTQFDCGDNRCIPIAFKCDGLTDCENGRDEIGCPIKVECKSTEFDCGNGRCIISSQRCDNYTDCENGNDEMGCTFTPQPPTCKSNEFNCGDGRCIQSSMRCDNYADCENGKDEMGCRPYTTSTRPNPFCGAGQFACRKNFQCIADDLRCNGRQDCYDATDEDNCGESIDLNLKAIPTDQIIKESQEVVFQCRDESLLRAPIRWERGNGLPLPPGSRVSEFGRLEIPNIQLSHGGPYICRVSDEYRNLPKSQIQVYLQVQPFTTPAPVAPAARCRSDEATCHNGDCIPRNLVCNGQNDCADGSDELRCNPHGCEPNEFRCKNLRCVSKTWRCDSEDDCGDGSDEENCEPAPPGSRCRYDEFACTNVTQCVPKSMQCDFENDCHDGTDEHGCSKVTVVQPPIPSITIFMGGSFTITCNTIGTPMPEVIWRWNWGHVPPRCTSTSVNGLGTLTCVDVLIDDAGAYSCEAINSRGSVFAPVDTIVTILGNDIAECKTNKIPTPTPERCTDCFCFKASSRCTLATNLYIFNLPVSGDKFRVINVHFDRRRRNRLEIKGNEISDPSLMVDVLSGDQFRVRGAISQSLYFENIFPYLALPDTFLGNQLKSYGGIISFLVRYESDDALLEAPHLIIAGDGRKLVSGNAKFSPHVENLVSTQFAVGSWFHEGDNLVVHPDRNVPASREEIMSILANLEYILIRTQWTVNNIIDVTISEFKFESARSFGSTRVGFVEQCDCPAGYSGLSCENCEPGYERIRSDSPYGICRRVVGCDSGYFGMPARGIPCRPCPCPLTEASNQFGHSCHLESDGRPTCDCPPGYEGRNCERCSAGFYGSPLVLGSSCERTPCDTAGSISSVIDPVSRTCTCKQNVFGPYCKQCKVGTFFLHSENQYGCINCFCMGVSKECQSSALYRQHVVSTFGQDTQEFKIALRKDVAASPISDIFTNPPEREIVYRPTADDNNGVLYWILPQKFLNDKTTSYGGVLNYTLRFTPATANSPRNVAPDVEIYSGTRRVRLLYYRQGNPLESDAHQTISVPLREQYWQREDGQIANREHLLMTLSHLTMIIIKASYTTTTAEVALQSVLLETAEDRNTGYRRAYEVEECRCPEGHRGLSCQLCSPGYYRSDNLYLGTCQPCNCNGLSRECDPETGYCLNCADHAYGPKCEQCEPGYVGDPSKGVPCRRTNDPGCNCDPRGSVDPTCREGFCACKANVFGQRCDQCKPGTFDLRATRDAGCLDCYCSGVSQQCQSSDTYVTQILVSVLDKNPGFALTDSNRNRVIQSGLNLNPAKNEIQFDYTTERGNRLYWSLPPLVLGNKITSYGGSLTWTQGYDAPAEFIPQYDSDMIIIGDGITLHWTNNNPILPNQAMPVTVKLEERSFRRVTENGTQVASRTDLMRVLSNIEAILIRALYASQTTSVYISDVLLDMAVTQRLSAARATQVELCTCPVGYKGTSCEACERGYYHIVSSDGITKECIRCPCNGNEESCEADSSSTVKCRCRPNYSGDFCEGHFFLNVALKPTSYVYAPIGSEVNLTCVYKSSDQFSITFWKTYTNISRKGPFKRFDEQHNIFSNSTHAWMGEQNLTFIVEPNLNSILCVVVKENINNFATLQVAEATVVPSAAGDNQVLDPNFNTSHTDTTPTVSIQTTDPKEQSVPLGTTVQYIVRARSIRNAPVVITWSKVGGTLPSDRVIDDGRGTLVITNVIASDSGVYLCTVFDGFTYAHEEFSLTVADVATSKPKLSIISTRPEGVTVLGIDDFLELNSGEIFNIRCEATGVPTPTVELMKLGTPAVERKLSPGSVSLLITSVSVSNAGTYFCRASNRYGTDQQRLIVRVREATPSPPPPGVRITIQPAEFSGFTGESVRFVCSVEPSFGLRYVWTRAGSRPLPQRATSDPRGELTIYNVEKADAGEYVCTAVNEATGTEIGKMEVFVRVFDRSDTGPNRPPTASIDPVNQRVPQGSLAIVRCTSNDPRAQIVWRKMGDNLTASSEILVRGSELKISSVQLKHRGNYLCYVTNAHGSAQAYSRLEVDRREFPSVEIYPKERMPIVEGGDTLIQCKVNRGIPVPRLRWYRPGNLTISSHVEEISGVLRFTHVTAEDEGEYICSAENTAGHVEAVAFLEITKPPKVYVSPRGPLMISVGQYLKLECRADGKPMPQVVWRSGSLPISPYGYNQESVQHTAVLEISRAQISDSGAYTCTASSIAGQAEDVVQVVVSGSPSNNVPANQVSPNIQASLSPDEEVAFPLGSKATFRCDMGNQKDAEYLYWQRENGGLSEQRDEQNGILIIYNVRESDAGKYTCIGVGKRATVLFKKTINLRVVVPPQIHLNPIRQVVRPGDDAYVSCTATGDQPISVYWSAVGGNQLPKSVSVDRGMLQFRGITIYDAGKYVCRAENFAGRVEAVAEVLVNEVNRPSRPTITALQRTQTAIEGSDVDLRCEVRSSTSDYQIKWNRDKSGLPRRSELFGDTLRLISVTPADIDRYTCEVVSPYGSSTDFIDLFVDRSCLQGEVRCNDGITCIPNSQVCDNTRNCPDNSDEVNCHNHRRGINKTANDDELTDFHMNAGDSFRLSCWINDTSSGPMRGMWSRIDGSFDQNVQIEGNLLSINNVHAGNTGNYRCSIFTNEGDKFKDYKLHVKLDDLLPTLASMSKKTVQYGDTIDLLCAVDLEPPVNYSWVLHTHEKSLRKIIHDVKTITIPNASVGNSGLYFCNAVGKGFTFRLPTMLLVEGVIPAFKGTSYMTFSPLTQASMSFNIEITFKPNHREGLLLYTGQTRNGKGDFMAFGLNKGYPELKFDVGSKPVTITADVPVTLHEWHTVRLIREGKTGTLEVDGRWNVTKTAEGKHETLDLTLPLYVGGLPNFEVIRNRTGFTSGYMGCLKNLIVDSDSYDLKKAIYSNELVSCNTCANDPCQNGGGCQESLSSTNGSMCICPPGFSGEHCAYAWDTCYLDTCGEGHCIENESGSGTECQCPYGKTGKACAQNVIIKTPAFTKNSYLAYPSMFMKKDKLDISLIVKPVGENDVEDGIIAYVAEDEDGLSDYVAISIVNAFVELEGKIMSKQIKIRSERLVKPGINITIHAVISPSYAKLVVDDETRESEFNPTNEIHDMKFNTALYVGGVDRKTIIMPSNIIIRNGLFGCIPNVKLNGLDITHVQTYTDSANVNDCLTIFGDICEKSQPCLNNGKCYPHGTKGYRCECELEFAGDNCDRKKDVCEMLKPCKNNAECQVTDGNNFLCSCPLGFYGSICDERTVVENTASFMGHSFVELSSVLLPHEGDEFFSITFITNSTSGLLFWQGSKERTLRPNDDFLSLTVENGYVQLKYRIKSVEREIKASDHKVNDGLSHTVIIRLNHQRISVELDSRVTDFKDVTPYERLQTRGSIFIGGLPNIRYMTQNMFRNNFNGCIQSLKMNNNHAIHFGVKAVSASNVAPCSAVFTNEVSHE